MIYREVELVWRSLVQEAGFLADVFVLSLLGVLVDDLVWLFFLFRFELLLKYFGHRMTHLKDFLLSDVSSPLEVLLSLLETFKLSVGLQKV